MKKYLILFLWVSSFGLATAQDSVIEKIIREAETNSQLESQALELLDGIGPRLVGSPQMKEAADWIIKKYADYGIKAEVQNFGDWRAWQRGISHVEMTYPRIKSLEGTQLAWTPNQSKPVEAEVVVLPKNVKTKAEFEAWLPSVKGKIVLISMNPISGRSDAQWKEFATEEDIKKYQSDKKAQTDQWASFLRLIDYTAATLPVALEKNGAAGLGMSYWTGITGAQRIFGGKTKKIPTVDIALEDYGLLYRLAENGKKPKIKITAESKDLGVTKVFNTIATIPGTEKPNEYVVLSAHFDSWDGGTGATDNGSGTIVMLEAARILKKVLPNPKRTIIVGHWGSEEQGLNGSRAFVEDHPEIANNTVAVFNQDNGTGRVVNISGQGFVHAYDLLGQWLAAVPKDITKHIQTSFPGVPSGGGSDHAAFVAKGVPAFGLGSLNWDYFGYTWHTNRDTYDKLVFSEIKKNVILTAILAYKASEEEGKISRERRIMPIKDDGSKTEWPEAKSPIRKGELD